MKSRCASSASPWALALVLTTSPAWADQTDKRLEPLFATLQSSESARVQREAESAIWLIWLESGREDISTLMGEGREALQSGKLEQAEEIFTRVIDTLPAFSEGWNARATVRYHRRDYTGSLDDIERTLALEPRHFGAIWGKGMILGLQREFPEAIRAFEKLLQIAPHSRDVKHRIEVLENEMEKNAV